MADGDLDPEALADYLGDANAEMFNPPVIGAEVYQLDRPTPSHDWGSRSAK